MDSRRGCSAGVKEQPAGNSKSTVTGRQDAAAYQHKKPRRRSPRLRDRTDWRFHPKEHAEYAAIYGPFTVDACADPAGENAVAKKFYIVIILAFIIHYTLYIIHYTLYIALLGGDMSFLGMLPPSL